MRSFDHQAISNAQHVKKISLSSVNTDFYFKHAIFPVLALTASMDIPNL